MNKQVEVPERLRAAVANAMETRAAEAQRATDDGLDYLDLADVAISPIYKHFSDRLLSDEARAKAEHDLLDLERDWPDDLLHDITETVLEAALQATSTPEVDRG